MSVAGHIEKIAESKVTDSTLVKAANAGDITQVIISGSNAALTTTGHVTTALEKGSDALATLAEKTDKMAPLLNHVSDKLEAVQITSETASTVRDVLAKGAIAVTVAQGVYDVYKEQGVEHKIQRGVAATLTAGTGYAVNAAISATQASAAASAAAVVEGTTAVAGTVATGGAVVVASTPVAVTVGLIVAPVVLTAEVAYGSDQIIKTERTYESVDSSFKPDMKLHSNVIGAEAMVEDRLKKMGATKDSEGHWDMTNPKNVEKFKLAITQKQDDIKDTIADNRTYLPRWLDSTNKGATVELAKVDARMLDSALTELPDYQQKMAEHHQQKNTRTQAAALAFKANNLTTHIADATPGHRDADIKMPATLNVAQSAGTLQRT